jgi:mannose-6-phosphate isomerase-like protein (cupin superfamily)
MSANETNASRQRGKPSWKALGLPVLLAVVVFNLAGAEGDGPPNAPKSDAQARTPLVQSLDKVEKEESSWGWIGWLMSAKIDPNAEMTFGIVEVKAGQANPVHVHRNCEEQLYVLSGSCEHRIGEKTVVLKAGDMLRIPRGVPHAARTFDKEPMRAVIVYSSGQRQFEVVEP